MSGYSSIASADIWFGDQGRTGQYHIETGDYSSQILNAQDVLHKAESWYNPLPYDFSNGVGAWLHIEGGYEPYPYYSIQGLRGFSELQMYTNHDYAEDTPALSTAVLPVTYEENGDQKTKAIPIKYFNLYSASRIAEPLETAVYGKAADGNNPYYGRVVTLLKLKNYYDQDSQEYVGLSDNLVLKISRAISDTVMFGSEDTIISVDSEEKRDYTINDSAATITTRKGLVSHDEMDGADKYSYIKSMWNATAEITFGQNVKWNTTSPIVSKSVGAYDAGNYSEAVVNLKNLTFDSVTPNSTITLFDGSGLNHVNYTKVTAPTNVTWNEEDNNRDTKNGQMKLTVL